MCAELGEEVKSWQGYEKYGSKLVTVSERLIQQAVSVYNKKPGQINVLNHGDCWTANMLFKYNDIGKVADACLIDFQISFYGSPAFDFYYFFYTSANDDVKLDHNKPFELIHYYHEVLTDTLKKLGGHVKPPSLFQLTQEYYQRKFISVVYLSMFPIMLNENEKDADIEHLTGETEQSKSFRQQCFKNPRVIRNVKHFLPLWDSQGLLDALE